MRAQWDGPLIIKGILDPDDAREAAAQRRRRRSSSRTMAGGSSTARCRPRGRCRAIADAVAGRLPVLVDGGVRSGLDVVRMLALGADFVLLGRAWAYALAARGGAGVAHVLKLIEAEMRVAMALTGCTAIAEIDEQIARAERRSGDVLKRVAARR